MLILKLCLGAFFILWAVLKIIDIVIEIIVDGIDPGDIMWWINRPISMRGEGLDFGMLWGALTWIILIVGTALGFSWWGAFLGC